MGMAQLADPSDLKSEVIEVSEMYEFLYLLTVLGLVLYDSAS